MPGVSRYGAGKYGAGKYSFNPYVDLEATQALSVVPFGDLSQYYGVASTDAMTVTFDGGAAIVANADGQIDAVFSLDGDTTLVLRASNTMNLVPGFFGALTQQHDVESSLPLTFTYAAELDGGVEPVMLEATLDIAPTFAAALSIVRSVEADLDAIPDTEGDLSVLFDVSGTVNVAVQTIGGVGGVSEMASDLVVTTSTEGSAVFIRGLGAVENILVDFDGLLNLRGSLGSTENLSVDPSGTLGGVFNVDGTFEVFLATVADAYAGPYWTVDAPVNTPWLGETSPGGFWTLDPTPNNSWAAEPASGQSDWVLDTPNTSGWA